ISNDYRERVEKNERYRSIVGDHAELGENQRVRLQERAPMERQRLEPVLVAGMVDPCAKRPTATICFRLDLFNFRQRPWARPKHVQRYAAGEVGKLDVRATSGSPFARPAGKV